jgi:hypothetical protein
MWTLIFQYIFQLKFNSIFSKQIDISYCLFIEIMHYCLSWSIILNIWCELFFQKPIVYLSGKRLYLFWSRMICVLHESIIYGKCSKKNFEHCFVYQSMKNKTLRTESLKIVANKIRLITSEWILEYLIQILKVNKIYLYINKCKFRSFKILMTKAIIDYKYIIRFIKYKWVKSALQKKFS